MLWHGQELMDWPKNYFGWFYVKRKLSWRCKATFLRKVFIMTTLTTFWALIARFPISFVTRNKKHSKGKFLLYLKPSIAQKHYFQHWPPFFLIGHIYSKLVPYDTEIKRIKGNTCNFVHTLQKDAIIQYGYCLIDHAMCMRAREKFGNFSDTLCTTDLLF